MLGTADESSEMTDHATDISQEVTVSNLMQWGVVQGSCPWCCNTTSGPHAAPQNHAGACAKGQHADACAATDSG